MFQEMTRRSPQLLGVALILYGVGGLIAGELEVQPAFEKIVIGAGLLGFHSANPPPPKVATK